MNLKYLQCGRARIVFRTLPTKSLAVKGEKCTGGKKVQTKTYSCYCVGVWWEKLEIVIGKTAKTKLLQEPEN
jgi:hypothetical protein